MEIRNKDLNFYSPFSRFWELAVGAMLAYSELNYKISCKGICKHLLAIFGLVFIGYSVFFFDSKTPHPSYHTLIPVVGVALIIGFASKGDLVGKVLGAKPLVWIGLISYSAYLWHFPIMAFSRILLEKIDLKVQILWIFLTFLLAIITYFLVERPFRNRHQVSAKALLIWLSISFLLSIGISYTVIANEGFKNRVPNSVLRESFDDRFANLPVFDRCHRRKGENPIPEYGFCELGEPKKNKVYLVGDSHMVSIAFELSSYLQKRDSSLVLMTRGGSLFGRKPNLDMARIKMLEEVEDSVIIFGGFAHRETKEYFIENFDLYDSLFGRISSRNNKIVIVYPFPSTNINRKRLAQEFLIYGELVDKNSSLKTFRRKASAAYQFYDELSVDNIFRIYPTEFLCDDEYCFGVKDQRILISDYDHPSHITAIWVVNRMDSMGIFD